MPLDYADFERFYEREGIAEEQRRMHFEAFSCLLECIVRVYAAEAQPANSLGISLDRDTLALVTEVESKTPLRSLFNGAASHDAPGKKES